MALEVRPNRITDATLGERSRAVAKGALAWHHETVGPPDSRGITRDFDGRVTAAPGLLERPLDAPEIAQTHVGDDDPHAS